MHFTELAPTSAGNAIALLNEWPDYLTSLDTRPNSSTPAFQRTGIRAFSQGPPSYQADLLSDMRRFGWMSDHWGEAGSRCGASTADKSEGDQVRVVPMLCGQWGCVVCGRLRYRWFVRNVERETAGWKRVRFVTLTLDHGQMSAAESWVRISTAWNRLRGMIVRRWGAFRFIWVVEPQVSGHAHLHLLVDLYLPQDELTEMWRRASDGSYIVHVRAADRAGGVRYLAKYMSKSAVAVKRGDFGLDLTGKHVYGKSRGMDFSPFRVPCPGWQMQRLSFKDYARSVAKGGGQLASFNADFTPSFVYRPFGGAWEPWEGGHGDVLYHPLDALPHKPKASSSEPESESESESRSVGSVVLDWPSPSSTWRKDDIQGASAIPLESQVDDGDTMVDGRDRNGTNQAARGGY